jgi:hypothetical protein
MVNQSLSDDDERKAGAHDLVSAALCWSVLSMFVWRVIQW